MQGTHRSFPGVTGQTAADRDACWVLLVQQLEAVHHEILSAVHGNCWRFSLQEVLKVGLLGITLLQGRHNACYVLCLSEPRLGIPRPTEPISDPAPLRSIAIGKFGKSTPKAPVGHSQGRCVDARDSSQRG